MKKTKQIIGSLIVLVTLLAFFYAWHKHPELLQRLKQVSPISLVVVLMLYTCMIALLVLIYDTTLRLCGHRLKLKEQTLLTMYSSIANFFGPLQSGPGVRTVYLKKRHHVSIAKYMAATAMYYLLFAGFSGLFLLSGVRPLWLAGLICLVVPMIGVSIVWLLRGRLRRYRFVKDYSRQLAGRLAVVTLLQVILVTVIYFVELRATGAHVSIGQTVIYTGAANFSLFVSLTPGGLGFRESFLLFSRRLHHIDVNTIISANVIDRGVYVVFLGVLFLIVLALHAQSRFSPKIDSEDS